MLRFATREKRENTPPETERIRRQDNRRGKNRDSRGGREEEPSSLQPSAL